MAMISHAYCFVGKVLLESFEGSMRTLQDLSEKNQRRVDKLEHVCLKQEKEHAARIGELEGLYAVSNLCCEVVMMGNGSPVIAVC